MKLIVRELREHQRDQLFEISNTYIFVHAYAIINAYMVFIGISTWNL